MNIEDFGVCGMKYTVWEEFFRWRMIVRKNVSKRTAEKLVKEYPVGRP